MGCLLGICVKQKKAQVVKIHPCSPTKSGQSDIREFIVKIDLHNRKLIKIPVLKSLGTLFPISRSKYYFS